MLNITVNEKQLALAIFEAEENAEHKIFSNGQGGYDCECGARWDWQRREYEDAKRHEKVALVEALMKKGIIKRLDA